jgi:hypothetical protein
MLMMMMMTTICLCPSGCGRVECGVLIQYVCDVYVARGGNIVTTETKPNKETVREMRRKDRKCRKPEEEEEGREEKE